MDATNVKMFRKVGISGAYYYEVRDGDKVIGSVSRVCHGGRPSDTWLYRLLTPDGPQPDYINWRAGKSANEAALKLCRKAGYEC